MNIHDLFAHLARLIGGRMPSDLAPAATWAAPRFAPLARMLVGVAARKGLAEYAPLCGVARRSCRKNGPTRGSAGWRSVEVGPFYRRRSNVIGGRLTGTRPNESDLDLRLSRNMAYI